jgi:hypothetical protein
VRIKRSLLAGLIAAVTLGAAPIDDTFVGTISDDMCAMSHAVMRMGPTDAECTNACIEEHGGSYVLVVGEHVYKLSDQRAPKAFAGQTVKVVGTLDPATQTITVTSMAKA